MYKFFLILISSICLFSCSNRLYTGNGAYHNASFTTDQYEIEELTISNSGSSFLGIPLNQKKNRTSGFTFVFNGISISKVPQFFPALTLIAFTWQSGNLMNIIGVGSEKLIVDDYGYVASYRSRPNFLSYLLGLPVSATLNSLIWKGASKGAAGSEINSVMLEQNPDVDMFLFPKYSVQTEGFYSEKSKVTLKVKAATLKD
jgi:hypothetical protein